MLRYILMFSGSLLSIAVGLIIIISWYLDISILKSISLQYESMKFNTAFCFVLSGISLFALVSEKTNYIRKIFILSTILLLLIGTTTLLEWILGFDCKIDQFFVLDDTLIRKGHPYPGRMSPITAFCFTLLGISFLFNVKNNSILHKVSQYLLHTITLISFIAIIGYLLGAPRFYNHYFLTGMAIHTSLTLFLLSLSVSMFHFDLGITGLFTGEGLGNIMARRLFPSLMSALLVFGFIRIELHRHGIVEVEFGIALFAISFLFIGLFLIWNTSHLLNQMEEKRNEAEREILRINQNLEKLVEDRTLKLQNALVEITIKEEEEKKSQLKIEEIELHSKMILDNVFDGIITINRHGIIQSFNKSAEKLFGFDADEIIGKNVSILMPEPFQSKHDTYLSLFFETGIRKVIGIGRTVPALRGDGSIFTAEVAISESISNNEVLFIGLVRDISERKFLEEQIKHSQKMEAIGQLAGGIAHDFNNILGIIIGNLDLIELYIQGNDKALNKLEELHNIAIRGAGITQRLLSFSRKKSEKVSTFSPNEFILNLSEILKRLISKKVEILLELSDDVASIDCNPSDFENSLLNLSINANDAMLDEGTLKISTERFYVSDEDHHFINKNLRTGEYVKITVKDSGSGMTKEVLENVFNPFFTTKPEGKGTGLGLTTVYNFAKQSNGIVYINSEIGKGTEVVMLIPASLEIDSNQIIDSTETEFATLSQNLKILVVDDEVEYLNIVESFLDHEKIECIKVENSTLALDALEVNRDIKMMITDIIMPGEMDGISLANEVNKRYPNIKIFFASGFSKHWQEEEKLNYPLLKKPYRRNDLLKLIYKISRN